MASLLLLVLLLSIWPNLSIVYESHIDFLYVRYKDELKSARSNIEAVFQKYKHEIDFYQFCTCSDSTAFGEMIYMQIRETESRHALDISLYDDISSSMWGLMALSANNISHSRLTAIATNWDSTKELVTGFATIFSPGVTFEPIEMPISLHTSKVLQNLRTKAIDLVSLTGFYSPKQLQVITHKLLDPLANMRPITKAGFVVLFYPAAVVGGSVSSHNSIDKRQPTKHAVPHGGPLLHWLQNTTTMAVDITTFGTSATLSLLNKCRRDQLESLSTAKLFLLDEKDKKECSFSFATVLKRPRITIIIPVLRPEQLPEVFATIRFNLVSELIIVYSPRSQVDEAMLPRFNSSKIREIVNPVNGIYGNPERSFGLANIPKRRVGWVYFLDDDNFMHNNAFIMMQTKAVVNVLFFGMEHCPNAKHPVVTPSECTEGKVDTGNAIFSAQAVMDLSWPHDVIGDGIFCEQVCAMDHTTITYHPILASYHNGMRCKDLETETI